MYEDGSFRYILTAFIDGEEKNIYVNNKDAEKGNVYRYTESAGVYKLIPHEVEDGIILSGKSQFIQSGSGIDEIAHIIESASGAEIELVQLEGREKRLKKALDKIRDNYDYIFIDCPPSLGLLTINSLTAVDSVLIPIQCEFYALEGVSQLMSTIEMVKKTFNKGLEIEGVILSMFDGRTNLSIQVVEEVKKYFGSKVYTTIIPRNVRLAEAPSFGLPISIYDPKSKGAEAYAEFAEEFIEEAEGF
ncbi:MAG: ParA family protein [Firmicutes bacterium]|nr:ParA family protein [Bacillota bacterium]